jgi:hypothetical protein
MKEWREMSLLLCFQAHQVDNTLNMNRTNNSIQVIFLWMDLRISCSQLIVMLLVLLLCTHFIQKKAKTFQLIVFVEVIFHSTALVQEYLVTMDILHHTKA